MCQNIKGTNGKAPRFTRGHHFHRCFGWLVTKLMGQNPKPWQKRLLENEKGDEQRPLEVAFKIKYLYWDLFADMEY